MQLLWGSQPNITSYIINQLRASSDDVADVKSANGGQNVFVVGNLNPSTEYCFKIAAVRGEQTSQLSEKSCATTTVAAQVTTSPSADASGAPESAAASATESSAPATDAAPASSPAANGQPGGDAVVAPPPADVPSSGQNGSAASTAPSSPPPSTVGNSQAAGPPPVFTANQYIDVIATNPAADAQALERAQGRLQEFAAKGVVASILRTTDFPQFKIAGNTPKDSYLVYVGPFGSAQEAQARCAAQPLVGSLCESVRPSPGT